MCQEFFIQQAGYCPQCKARSVKTWDKIKCREPDGRWAWQPQCRFGLIDMDLDATTHRTISRSDNLDAPCKRCVNEADWAEYRLNYVDGGADDFARYLQDAPKYLSDLVWQRRAYDTGELQDLLPQEPLSPSDPYYDEDDPPIFEAPLKLWSHRDILEAMENGRSDTANQTNLQNAWSSNEYGEWCEEMEDNPAHPPWPHGDRALWLEEHTIEWGEPRYPHHLRPERPVVVEGWMQDYDPEELQEPVEEELLVEVGAGVEEENDEEAFDEFFEGADAEIY